MSEQQNCRYNILSNTSRKFYSRKKPSHEVFSIQPRLSKVIKALNFSQTMNKINKYKGIKTQQNEKKKMQTIVIDFNESQFIKKQLKAKIEINLKKVDKKWRRLYQNYEDLKICTTKQSFMSQQNNFYRLFSQLVRKNADQQMIRIQKQKKNVKQQNKQNNERISKYHIQNIKLVKELQVLRRSQCQLSSKGNKQIIEQNDPFFQNSDLKTKRVKQRFKNESNQDKTVNQKEKYQAKKDDVSKLKDKIHQQNQKIFDLQNQSFKLKQELVSAQDSLKLFKQDKLELSQKVLQLKNQNQTLCSQIVKINLQHQNYFSKFQRWKSIIAFQKEQIFSYETQLLKIKNQYKDLMRKYKLLLKKLNQMTNHNSSANGFQLSKTPQLNNSKYLQIFKQQLQAFSKIRYIFFNKQSENVIDKNSFFTQKKYSSSSNQSTYQNYLTQKETFNNTNGVKKISRQYYAYFKPNFYNFVENYMDLHGIDQNTFQQFGGGFDLTCQFLSTTRAILDCKFNQFLTSNFNCISSFASFTYAWLSKYRIHKKQKKIIQIKGDLDKDTIPQFFMNLMSQKLNCNWQIMTFRQFLLDSLTLDQLYFYLMARHYMFEGQFLANIKGVYQQIFYITVANALNLLQKFITDINYRKKIEEYIKRFIIYIRKRALLDAHFILRILLQFYQAKKHQQFTNLNSLSQLLSKEKLASFSFESFLKIFQYNFSYLSLTQKLQIYRKCYSSSRGKINLQIILTVLNEDGYLCRQVKQVFLNDQIFLLKNQDKNQAEDLEKTGIPLEITQFQTFFQQFFKQNINTQIINIGVQRFQKFFQQIKDSNRSKIFSQIQCVFNMCLLSLKKIFYSKKISIQNFLPILKEITQMLKKFNKLTCQKKMIIQIMMEFKRNTAAKKILRFYRKKRSQMHRHFILGLKDEILQQDQKILNLRKQFNSMIENLKEKFQKQEM